MVLKDPIPSPGSMVYIIEYPEAVGPFLDKAVEMISEESAIDKVLNLDARNKIDLCNDCLEHLTCVRDKLEHSIDVLLDASKMECPNCGAHIGRFGLNNRGCHRCKAHLEFKAKGVQ